MGRNDLSRREFMVRGGATVAGAALLGACTPLLGGSERDAAVRDRLTRSFNPIPRENRRDGSTGWKQSGEHDGGISGFGDKLTVRQGEAVTLFVTTEASSYRAEVYRMGWYGGKGARLMHVEDGLKGVRQDDPILTKPIDNMVEAWWEPSVRLRTSRKWTTGVYLVKLRSSSGSENYIPFVVRDDRPSAIFYQLPVTTWLAYNVYGGRGIYKCIFGRDAGDWNGRSRLASFDRPFSQDDSGTRNGADRFFNFDLPMLRFLERSGYDVSYGTSIETHDSPKLLMQHDMFLSAGHDEYWSMEMRDNLEAIRQAGVNLAFLGANAGYRAVRLEKSSLGRFRRMRHYKEYTEDPFLGKNDDKVAAQWRYGPLLRPESELLGIMYAASPVDDPWVCSRTDHWLYEGTGITKGYEVPHMVGHEYDRMFDDAEFGEYTPDGLEILAESPVGVRGDLDKVISKDVSHTSLYQHESGAGVFASGTIRWSWFLDDIGGSYYQTSVSKADPKVQKLTAHLLESMSNGPMANYLERNGHS